MLTPITSSEWNEVRAAHLFNRAGFGASLSAISAAARRRPEEVVEQLVEFQGIPDSFRPPDWAADAPAPRAQAAGAEATPEEQQMARMERRQEERRQLADLRSWWIERMLYSPHPLQEKLTLFWHGHFATGFRKVSSARAMYLQNQTFREHANGNWEEILVAVAKDPAMLVYLDNARSRAAAPNENFARELLELFTLGEGHYTEEDVREAARAFTGWSVDSDRLQFVFRARHHDTGRKRFMGRRGTLDGYDVLRQLARHPRSAAFMMDKLWEYFAYPEPEPEIVEALSEQFRKENGEFRPILKTIFLSRAFYSHQSFRTQIKSPIQFFVGAIRALEADLPRNQRATARALRALGQELFDPPNVSGWLGGTAWISTGSLMQRYRLADAMVKGFASEGIAFQLRTRFDADRVLPRYARAERRQCREYLQWRLYQSLLRPRDADLFDAYIARRPLPSRWSEEEVKDVISFMMKTPQYQLT